jgi:hypothetical protein
MKVLNVHERELPVSVAAVGVLLNSLASDEDTLWPKTMWPPLRFDRPLGVGACGGHGPVRYSVEEFIPGRMVKCRFTAPRGFLGYHSFEILPKHEGCAVLRHIIDMNAEGAALLSWPIFFRPLHDALLEDSLALAQSALGEAPDVRPWSPWVKFLRWVFSAGMARSQQTPSPAMQLTCAKSRAGQ